MLKPLHILRIVSLTLIGKGVYPAMAQLEQAGQLIQTGQFTKTPKEGLLLVNTTVPRQGIVFYKIDW
jgi:hypothetical protein